MTFGGRHPGGESPQSPWRDRLPASVILTEVGPRDGFQFESAIIPTDLKIEFIRMLADAGFSRIQAVAFVHPEKVPQMADAAEVARRLPRRDGLTWSALALNLRGVERALDAGMERIEASVSASDAHSLRNAGMDRRAALGQGVAMIRRAAAGGATVIGGIQCALGCVFEGEIPIERVAEMVAEMAGAGADAITLADTTGMGNPLSVSRLLERVLPVAGGLEVGMHFHDTRGLGLANLAIALGFGIRSFDASVGGLGGCPFVPGAAGNIPTEDTVHLLAAMGIETGIDLERLKGCARALSVYLGRTLPGRIYRLDSPGSES